MRVCVRVCVCVCNGEANTSFKSYRNNMGDMGASFLTVMLKSSSTQLWMALKRHGGPSRHLRHGVENILLFTVHHGQDLTGAVTILTAKKYIYTQHETPANKTKTPQTIKDR